DRRLRSSADHLGTSAPRNSVLTFMTLFEKIARREIPAEIIYEADDFLAINDVNPQAPVHILIIPKRCIPRIGDAAPEDADLLGRMLVASGRIAEAAGVAESGYR